MKNRSHRSFDRFARVGGGAVAIERRVRWSWSRTPFLAVALLVLPLIPGCATPTRLEAVPEMEQASAIVEDMTGIRYWQPEDLALLEQDALDAHAREMNQAGN